MSISFSEDVNNEMITTAASLPEDNAEGSLRPRTITEYIGQEKAKENLSIFINAAKNARGAAGSRAAARASGLGQDDARGDNRKRDGCKYAHHLRPRN